MKRLILTFILATISGISAFSQDFLQVNALSKDNISLYKQKSSIQRNGENAIWSCDFEEGSPEPTLTKTDDSQVIWDIITESDYPDEMYTSSGGCYFLPMNYTGHPGNNDPHQQISETPDHWAFVDAGSDRYNSAPQINTSMTFSGIDLSSCAMPKVTFLQSWKELNSTKEEIKVETSLDGGATWTEHVVNDEEVASYTYINGYKDVLIPEAGNSDNVAIRFTYTSESGTWNYGWQIDDIKIVETPPCDLRLIDARISMFGYVDYRNVPATFPVDNWTSMTAAEKRNYVYQYYDPYAQSPRQQWATDNGYAAFNVEVLSMGSLSVIPKVRIKITNPNGSEIYNKVVSGARTLSRVEGDTVDFAYIDRGNPSASTMFFFENEEDIIVGRYTVDFYVFADGMDDADTINNHTTQYFDITENSFSKSYYEPTSNFKTNIYTASSDGDMYGTRFTYFYSPNDIMSADLFIAEGTTPGTSVRLVLFENNDGNLIQRGTSDLLNIGEENIGVWNTFLFSPEYNFSFASNETSREVIVAAQFYYDYYGDIYVGRSDVLSSYRHNSLGKFTYEEVFYNGYPDIALTFHTGAVGASTITVLSANESMGYVNGGGTFYEETQVTISATPYAGYRFVRWNDGNTDNPRTITVTEDATYIASFEALPEQYTITVLSANETMGYVSGSGTFYEGDQITISATPYAGYRFVRWNDGNTDNPRTITVTEDAMYIANFESIPVQYTITVLSASDIMGSVTGGGNYYGGSQTTISATPNEGYRFIGWNDGNTDNPRTITVTGNAIYIASFEELPAQFTITVLSASESMGSVTGGGVFYEGSQTTISATPNEGNRFVGWNDNNTDNPRTITVTGDAIYIASFEVNAYYSSFTATACGSYTWNDHTYTESGEYQQTFTASNSADSIVTLNLTIYAMPQPEITASGVLDGCNPSPITLSAGNYSAYNWSTGATTATISISEPGYYYVEVTDENGCIGISDQINVGISNAIPDAPQIAVVGLNNLNQNVVSWSAVENTNVNAYRIYRENNVANVYEPMATVEVSAQTFWTDETADPSARAYRYKITAVDECGGESPMSDYHKTMHLTINQGIGNTWNLIWSHYEGFDFGTYRIYRGTMPSNMTMIGEVPSNLNSYTDNTATASTGFYYQVEVVRNTRSRDAEISSRSNIVDNGLLPEYTITAVSSNPNHGTVVGGGTYPEGSLVALAAIPADGYEFLSWSDESIDNPHYITVTGDAVYVATFVPATDIKDNALPEIALFPNPATDILNITSTETISEIEIVNTLGQVVKRIEVNSDNAVCDVNELKAGVYVVRIRTLRYFGEAQQPQAQGAVICQQKFIKE